MKALNEYILMVVLVESSFSFNYLLNMDRETKAVKWLTVAVCGLVYCSGEVETRWWFTLSSSQLKVLLCWSLNSWHSSPTVVCLHTVGCY